MDDRERARKRAYLLNNSTSIHLQGQRQHMPLYFIGQYPLLVVRSVFEKLLNDVVAKHVHHQLQRVWQDLLENQLLLRIGGGLELLLNETGAVLVPAKFDDVPHDVLQLVFLVLVDAKLFEEGTSGDVVGGIFEGRRGRRRQSGL